MAFRTVLAAEKPSFVTVGRYGKEIGLWYAVNADVNGNSSVDIDDLIKAYSYRGWSLAVDPDDTIRPKGDINKDEIVDWQDFALVWHIGGFTDAEVNAAFRNLLE